MTSAAAIKAPANVAALNREVLINPMRITTPQILALNLSPLHLQNAAGGTTVPSLPLPLRYP
jgi:hypothetical protein